MTVLVDTPVWSFAYRRSGRSTREQAVVDELIRLIGREVAVLIGAVRQEVLSGIRNPDQFEDVRIALRGFPELRLVISDYERAAIFSNRCRRVGIQGSSTDFLICAAAERNQAAIFTTDKDFARYVKPTGIKLHKFES